MARAALVALAWAAAAAAAAGARYADYPGGMPRYGPADYDGARDPPPAADDYHGHSPDASAPLDYKFEEDVHGELPVKPERPSKELEERESWSKYVRRQRAQDDENLESLDKYDPEPDDNSKIKINRRMPPPPMYRIRHKIKKSRREPPQQRLAKYKRDRSDLSDGDYYQRGADKERQVSKQDTEESIDDYKHTKVTERIIRRKPRDRHVRGRLEEARLMNDDSLQPNRRIKSDVKTEPDYLLHDQDALRTNERESYRPVVVDREDVGAASKHARKEYDTYGDYYDMKRVHSIKSKLPTLLRRTSARVAPPTATSSGPPQPPAQQRTAPVPMLGLASLSVVPLPPSSPPAVTLAASAAGATATASARRATTSTLSTSKAPDELSLAEKSRLSILKKAQRKESVRNDTLTKKPLVLLQVTDKRLTVVMVEPPSSEGPWMRAREVVQDTAERVDRAKRLMRRKLVARAKDIQELTDNWDEMVCDYIDVALLDGAPPRAATLALVLALPLLLH